MKKKILIFLCIVLFLLFIGAIYESLKFRITGTSSFNTYSSYLDINFNKPIKLSSINVSSQPNIVFNYTLSSPKTIKVELLNAPTLNTVYTFNVSATSTSNNVIDHSVLVLKGNQVDFNSLTPAQQKSLVNTQDTTTKVATNKIFTILPYYSTYYYLTAQSNGTGNPTIVFTYLPAPSFEPAQEQALEPSKQTSISQAETWLNQQGVVLSNYNFVDGATNQPIN